MKEIRCCLFLLIFLIAKKNTWASPKNAIDSVQTHKGFIDIVQSGKRIYFDIPEKILNRDIMVISRYMPQVIEGRLPDDQIGKTGGKLIVQFKKNAKENKISLYSPTYDYLFNDIESSSLAKIFERSNALPVKEVFPISEGKIKDGTYRIDVTEWLNNGGSLIAGASGTVKEILKCYADTQKMFINTVRSTDKVIQPVTTLFYLLPAKPMASRMLDSRVGYFSTGMNTISPNGLDFVAKKFICRWRLEPKATEETAYFSGKLVEPKDPIVFYIDPAIPKIWVPYVKKAVESWRPALEQAGFKNAIFAKEAPKDDSTWSLAATRAAIVYKTSEISNAIGPNINDPRSGEIIQTHISWYHNILNWLWVNYFIQAGPSDKEARTTTFSNKLLGELIQAVISHEVGHCLGLLHNMGASSTVPVEKLRDNTWLSKNGLTPSTMDYARFNYVAQPNDKIAPKNLRRSIGDYDKWAIEYGYRMFPPFKSAQAEINYLDKWVEKKVENPRLLWKNGEWGYEGVYNAGAQTEDVGDDPIKASEYGVQNLKLVLKNIKTWSRDNTVEEYYATSIANGILTKGEKNVPAGQFSLYIGHVQKLIGGLVFTNSYSSQWKPIKAYETKEKQKEAIHFLGKYLFSTQDWLLNNPSISANVNLKSAYINLQGAVLFNIFHLLSHVNKDSELSDDHYTVKELLNDLKMEVWASIFIPDKTIDPVQRQLQVTYLQTVQTEILKSADKNECIIDVIAHLEDIRKEVQKALAKTKINANRLHYERVLMLLNVILGKSKLENL